jgi:hypothetical protein
MVGIVSMGKWVVISLIFRRPGTNFHSEDSIDEIKLLVISGGRFDPVSHAQTIGLEPSSAGGSSQRLGDVSGKPVSY